MGGLYAGVGPKMVHLGGRGAILAVLMPRFKAAEVPGLGTKYPEDVHSRGPGQGLIGVLTWLSRSPVAV